MKNVFRTLLTIMVLVPFASACSSSDKKDEDNLDVSMDKKPAEAPVTYANIVPEKKDGMTLPSTAVTNWQAFFKPAPTQHERSLLEQKLSVWKDDGNVKDMIQRGRTEIAVGRRIETHRVGQRFATRSGSARSRSLTDRREVRTLR